MLLTDLRHTLRQKARTLWKERRTEILIVLLGVVLRISLQITFSVWRSYDSVEHWKYAVWFHDHWELPPLNAMMTNYHSKVEVMTESYHPPLWYFISGMILRLGGRGPELQGFAVMCGSARLLLLWLGFERWLPGGARPRRLALLLAAVLPASVFLDGMLGAEPLSNLLATAMLVLTPSVFAAEGPKRVKLAGFLGLLAGLALLAKISALVLIGAIGAGALIELVTRPGDARTRMTRLTPFFGALLVCTLTCGSYFARNIALKGKPFLSSFDCTQQDMLARIQSVPYLSRRPPSYLLGWDREIHKRPLYPIAGPPDARFWPQLIATTFVDYYNYGYGRQPARGEDLEEVNNRPFRSRLLPLAVASFNGGVVIALVTVIAWAFALAHLWRKRDAGRLTLMIVPLLAIVGAVHFAWAYPFDKEGVVKGAYLQFAAAPLIGLFGLAVDRLWRRHEAYALPPLLALVAVSTYTIVCRLMPF